MRRLTLAPVPRGLWALVALVAVFAACGSSSESSTTTATPGRQSTPVAANIASGAGSNSLEGAVGNVATAEPGSPPPILVLPVVPPYLLGEPFGVARLGGRLHGGLDFELQGSLDVLASCAGTVTLAGPTDAYDLAARIDCGGGWSVLVGYLGSLSVAKDKRVARGDAIASADPANPAIHFEVRWNDLPLDPARYLDFSGEPPETPSPGITPALPGISQARAPTPVPTSALAPATTTATRPRPTPTPVPPTPTATPTPKGATPRPSQPPPLIQ
jgi:hypothetical protein